jgi:hypothetical protein
MRSAMTLVMCVVTSTTAVSAASSHSTGQAPRRDSDSDGVPDVVEVALGLDPHLADTDGDGIGDGAEDRDHDRLTNRFEAHRTHTDPGSGDTDRDGIRDGAEDPDLDGLSNAGEERFSTDPSVADTDGDGLDDWHEDADSDGVADGSRQDAGSLPTDLRPTLADAGFDVPVITTRRCHSRSTDTVARACWFTYGRSSMRKRVVLTGDSHAAAWFPAIQIIARRRGWQLVTMTKSACPFEDVATSDGPYSTSRSCASWRAHTWARIAQLRPDMVIVTSFDRYTSPADREPIIGDSEWRAGAMRSLRHLRKASPDVVVLGDVYPWVVDALGCLASHRSDDISVCNVRRDSRWSLFTAQRDRIAAAAAAATDSVFVPTRQLVCPYTPCPVVVDGVLVVRDGNHITATYAARLWRGLDRILGRL